MCVGEEKGEDEKRREEKKSGCFNIFINQGMMQRIFDALHCKLRIINNRIEQLQVHGSYTKMKLDAEAYRAYPIYL